MLRGVLTLEADDDTVVENMCCEAQPINAIATKDYERIRFVAIDGRCVFDHLNPTCWIEYCVEQRKQTSSKKIQCISEKEEEEIDDQSCDGGANVTVNLFGDDGAHLNPPLKVVHGHEINTLRGDFIFAHPVLLSCTLNFISNRTLQVLLLCSRFVSQYNCTSSSLIFSKYLSSGRYLKPVYEIHSFVFVVAKSSVGLRAN